MGVVAVLVFLLIHLSPGDPAALIAGDLAIARCEGRYAFVPAAVGQRLVRTICPNCRVAYQPGEEELLDFNMTPADVADITFYRGEGCEECGFTGYKGRQGLFELRSAF